MVAILEVTSTESDAHGKIAQPRLQCVGVDELAAGLAQAVELDDGWARRRRDLLLRRSNCAPCLRTFPLACWSRSTGLIRIEKVWDSWRHGDMGAFSSDYVVDHAPMLYAIRV
jgi:hypothetical protein